MLEVGSTIAARVRAMEQDVVHLEYDGDHIFVQARNVTWSRFRELTDVTAIGATAKVKIIRFDQAIGAFEGSIKANCPELNPYIPLAAQPRNTRLRGVIKAVGSGRPPLVAFDSGAHGVIDEQGVARQLHVGQVVEVVIKRVNPDADEDNLELYLVEPWRMG